jgi:hypothetical protein
MLASPSPAPTGTGCWSSSTPPSTNKFKVPQRERNELLATVAGLKKDIVEK